MRAVGAKAEDDLDQRLVVGDVGAGIVARELQHSSNAAAIAQICGQMAAGEGSFWDVVHRPFLERDLNRAEVREIIAMGLESSRGSYKRLLGVFGLQDEEYLKFMDFLRHHRLKPDLQ